MSISEGTCITNRYSWNEVVTIFEQIHNFRAREKLIYNFNLQLYPGFILNEYCNIIMYFIGKATKVKCPYLLHTKNRFQSYRQLTTRQTKTKAGASTTQNIIIEWSKGHVKHHPTLSWETAQCPRGHRRQPGQCLRQRPRRGDRHSG